MSLLPALFQNTDPMPMALGAKIVAPVPKKPDPFKAFEKGNHTLASVDMGRAGGDRFQLSYIPFQGDKAKAAELMSFLDGLRKTFFDAASLSANRRWLVGDFETPIPEKIPVGETVEFFTGRNDHAAGSHEISALAPTLAERRAAVGMPPAEARTIACAPAMAAPYGGITPREEAIAAMMAALQTGAPLRALVCKDTKR